MSAVPGSPQRIRCAQGHEVPEAGGWRRTPGHQLCATLSAGGRATLLEPQDRKRSPSFQSDNRTRPSSCCVLRAARTEAERLRTVFTRWCGDHTRRPQRPWSGTGTAWSPSMTSRALGAPSHDEPGRITLRGPQASDRCRQYKRVDRAIAWKMLMVAEHRRQGP